MTAVVRGCDCCLTGGTVAAIWVRAERVHLWQWRWGAKARWGGGGLVKRRVPMGSNAGLTDWSINLGS